MAYPLSASRLQTYQRCPQSYYYRYERGIKQPGYFGAANLGTALHQALAKIYWDWHYQEPLPPLDWVHHCWQQSISNLSPAQVAEGKSILDTYYHQFIAAQPTLRKPVAVEGKLQGRLEIQNLEFGITGRYDRLDWFEDGLELIDYKSGRDKQIPESTLLDVQIGLYYLALEQRYAQSLKQLSLLCLRSGEKICFVATPVHRERVLQMIQDLAMQLRTDHQWHPAPGQHCDPCSYRRYCPAIQEHPEPLPESRTGFCRATQPIQLVLF
ncbi:endonuclease [Neosynechococcus sphagnicola sy1]|uniref:Endonuclease n=1 Tax=Neosynechococcus sphagnicola sy1 TaxID=1497020 RepID=A0A098TGS1_9CYAN|nr:PD-(D/E)XK nuclease family protein [Neosynechococcus sphagnicola]KGF71795.1 endonuclease [Neosynechococcus sphagnicola sy1]